MEDEMSVRDKLPLVVNDDDAKADELGVSGSRSGWVHFTTDDGYTVGACYMGDRTENLRHTQRIVALINKYGWEGDLA